MSIERTITIGENEADQRLDRFLRKLLEDVSLSAIYKLVRTRRVTVNRRKARPEDRLRIGDVVSLRQADEERRLDPALRRRAARGLSRRRDFRVVHDDPHLLAVNKPAGLLVHAGDRGENRDTLIDQVTAWLLEKPGEDPEDMREFIRPSPTFSPTLVHRLDRATSGLVLVGKTLPASRELSAMIRRRQIRKTYLALALGGLPQREGVIDVPIDRREDAKGRRRKVKTGQGKRAVTRYRVLAQKSHFSLLELELVTGRTHQIRAHLAHLNAPLAGDHEYGDRERNRHATERFGIKRQFLHAARLEFTHPITSRELDLCAPLWPDLREPLKAIGFADKDLPEWLPREEKA